MPHTAEAMEEPPSLRLPGRGSGCSILSHSQSMTFPAAISWERRMQLMSVQKGLSHPACVDADYKILGKDLRLSIDLGKARCSLA